LDYKKNKISGYNLNSQRKLIEGKIAVLNLKLESLKDDFDKMNIQNAEKEKERERRKRREKNYFEWSKKHEDLEGKRQEMRYV
jgi:hypothetical protein